MRSERYGLGMRSFAWGTFAVGLVACSSAGSASGDGATTAGGSGAGTGGAGDMPATGTGGGGGTAPSGCAVDSLLADCGFESPVVPGGGMQTYAVGQTFAGWTVVGASGNVALMSATFADMGFQWSAHDGGQMLDLTGTTRTATGVAQDIATTPGTTYDLSLWVGNLVDPTGYYGVYGNVKVMVDGVQVLLASNNDGDHLTVVTWEPFSVQFTATKDSTNIAFINDDSIVDNSNLIDDVVLTAM